MVNIIRILLYVITRISCNSGSVFLVLIFYEIRRCSFGIHYLSERSAKFGAYLLRHAEIWFLSGLSDIAYISVFFRHVH